MAWAPKKSRCVVCQRTFTGSGPRCPACESKNRKQKETRYRESLYKRYGSQWPKVRAAVLEAAGIPREEWPKWRVDHRPPFNPEYSRDHRDYELVPMLEADHNRKTAVEDMERDERGRFKGRKVDPRLLPKFDVPDPFEK